MANLSALAPITTAATALSNLVLVSPQATIGYQPQNPALQEGQTPQQPPPSFLFDYEGEQTVNLTSDITDHFIEDNTAIQDQIALKPEEVSTHGFISELNDIAPPALQQAKTLADKLTVINAYTPVLSQTALIAYNTAFQLYQVAQNAKNAGISAWSSINGDPQNGVSVITGNNFFPLAVEPNQTKQQIALQQFYGYWQSRTLFTVQTPWAIFQNMAIKSLRVIQSEETNTISSFEITFKIMRFASTDTTASGANSQGRAGNQSSAKTDLGTSTPAPSISLATGLSNNFPGLVG